MTALFSSIHKEPDTQQLNLRWTPADGIDGTNMKAAMISKARLPNVAEEIMKMDYYQSQKLWVASAMKKMKQGVASATVAKTSVLNKLRALIGKEVEALTPVTVPPIEVPLVLDTFKPKFYQANASGYTITITTESHLVDARMALEGEEHIFGMLRSDLPGNTLAEKETNFRNMNVDTFQRHVETGGFCFRASLGALYLLPPCFAMVTLAGNDGTHGVQWPLCGGEKCVETAREYMKTLSGESPTLCKEGALLQGFLGSRRQSGDHLARATARSPDWG